MRRSLIMCVAMLLAAVAAWRMAPHTLMAPNPVDLEHTVPDRFGAWHLVATPEIQVNLTGKADPESRADYPYDQTVMRTYVNDHGDQVMLALAYGKRQLQEIKIHRPEICYPAQGGVVVNLQSLPEGDRLPSVPLGSRSMLARMDPVYEQVIYWIRVGNEIYTGPMQVRSYIFREGLKGRIPDGILVRSSQRIHSPSESAKSIALQQRFLTELLSSLRPDVRKMLVPVVSES